MPLAVCTINHKGGVGKTTAALILAQTAAINGLKVLAVDLDPQKNLTDSIKFAHEYLKDSNIILSDTLRASDAKKDFDLFVIDCPPRLEDVTRRAVDFADIIIIPVKGDLYSLTNLGVVYDFIEKANKIPAQAALLKNGFEQTQTARSIEGLIQDKGYSIAGRWPINNHIPNNVASGRPWWSRMTKDQQAPFVMTYKKIWSAWGKLQAGDIINTWR